MVREAAKKAAKEAVEEVNWTDYFASIVAVCPWSKAYWQAQKIDIVEWDNKHIPLNGFVARIYNFTTQCENLINFMMRKNGYTRIQSLKDIQHQFRC